MKLILSRKGFDSRAGGVASPIFPDGSMYSLPIQAGRGDCTRYFEIRKGTAAAGTDMGTVVEQLTRQRIKRDELAHLEPDLDADTLPRLPGWRACFGQTGAAQAHLHNHNVGKGDLFLFFGWFKRVERDERGFWKYQRHANCAGGMHVIFGWLQVAEVIRICRVGARKLAIERPWLGRHPHLHFEDSDRWNTIYTASDRLVLPGVGDTRLPGAGAIAQFSSRLVLSADEAQKRGRWKLPQWFMAGESRDALSYHGGEQRWQPSCDGVLLQTVNRGQEFVLNCSNRPEAGPWLADLLQSSWKMKMMETACPTTTRKSASS